MVQAAMGRPDCAGHRRGRSGGQDHLRAARCGAHGMMASGADADLAGLRIVYPAWRIWRGETTGEYWAAPPAGHRHPALVNAPDPARLAAQLGDLSIRPPAPRPSPH